MQANILWKRLFKLNHIEEHYYEKIEKNPSVGMDRITPKKFSENLKENFSIIERKTLNGTYKFTKYKQILFSKGRGKEPRCICVPTLRDKLTLSILNELICEIYGKDAQTPMPHVVIDDIIKELNNFDSFIKLDIKTFYASINHDILIKEIKHKIRKSEIIELINDAIKTEAYSIPIICKDNFKTRTNGIPEGLSISNALANIYMLSIDKKYKNIPYIRYWRYVDDILILVNSEKIMKVEESINRDIINKGLQFNSKRDKGELVKGFEYLGYKISKTNISVRERSIYSIENSFENLLREYKKRKIDNIKYLEWKINLKITGFVLERKKYGWMFFYSQIKDISQLYHLDFSVKKILERNGIRDINIKRFVRSYHEIRQSLYETTYIPKIDKFSIDKKRDILSKIYTININKLSEEEIENKFRKIMLREIIDIKKDVQDIS